MVMTLSQISAEVEAWYKPILGTFVDEDGAYGAQCKDLISHYIRVVHKEPYTRGNGDEMADNLITQRGWTRVSVSSTWQVGDVVSIVPNHVYVLLEDRGSTITMVDLNGGPYAAGSHPDEAVKVRTVSKPSSSVVAIARPPRYVGGYTAPAPAPVEDRPSSVEILGQTMVCAQEIVNAAAAVGIPLHIGAAMVQNETSTGLNIYGHDAGGIYSTAGRPVTVEGVTYASGANVPVTRTNYKAFLDQLLIGNEKRTGVTSNGVGPTQITWWEYHRDARNSGADLSDPYTNLVWGFRILKGYLAGDYSKTSVEEAGTLYNAGSLNNGINAYGQRLWTRAEAWRVKLQGSVATPTTPGQTTPIDPSVDEEAYTPTPTPSTDPVLQEAALEVDPGPHAELLDSTGWEALPLPDPEPGPTRTPAQLTKPLAEVSWRGQWWRPVGGEHEHTLTVPGPDQNPLGSSMQSAAGVLRLARPEWITDKGWSPWRDDPPRDGEPVQIRMSDDGGATWWTKLTGTVDGASGSIGDHEVTMRVVDYTARLARTFSHPPLNFRQPATQDGARFMSIGLHHAYFINYVARRCGFLCTPPLDSPTTLVSVPAVGSMWPERGNIIGCKTMDEKGSSEGISSDSPEYRRTWWGLAVSNVFARIRPVFPEGTNGRLTRTQGWRWLVGPTTDEIQYVEAFWGDHSIMVQVSNRGVLIETQDAWLDGGRRRVVDSRLRQLTDEQKTQGFELAIWFQSDGVIQTIVGGVVQTHAAVQSWPAKMLEVNLTEVRLTARPGAAAMGGFQLVSSSDKSVLRDWEKTFHLDADPRYMLQGSPAIEDRAGLEVLNEAAEALLATMWMDELGHLHWVDRTRMDARPSMRTLTASDLESDDWQTRRDSVYSAVEMKGRKPSLNQNRMHSSAAFDVWEGPRDELLPGQIWGEEIISVPDNEDWFHVDTTFLDVTESTVAEADRGVGSVVGGTSIIRGEDSTAERPVPQSWISASARKISHTAYGVRVKHTPPEGTTAPMEMSVPELPGLRDKHVGRGPVLRARGKQTWEDVTLAGPVATGAVLERGKTLTLDAGWWVQNPRLARELCSRMAQMLAEPLPVRGEMPVASPDLSLRIADTVTLRLDAEKPQRLCGVAYTYDDTGVGQKVTTRQLRP